MPVLLFTVVLYSASVAGAASLQITPQPLKPGDPVVIAVDGVSTTPQGTFGDRPLHFYPVEDGFEALTALPLETSPGETKVEVVLSEGDGGKPDVLSAVIAVEDPHFPSRELTVAKNFIEPPPDVRRRIKADQKAFNEAYQQPFGPRVFRGFFIRPRDAEPTAPFGDLRTFNGKKQSQHYGLDLNGKVGDPIQAAHDGTVVLVRDCYSSGKTVLVSHGGDLFTAYFHMSEFAVRRGQVVHQGQRIGLVGRTGRVTGPHLHWGVKVDGLYANPEVLLKLPFTAPLESAAAATSEH